MLQEITKPILLQDLGMMYPNENSKQKKRYGLYQCYCGNISKIETYSFNQGKIKSCGCYRIAFAKQINLSHNLKSHSLYNIRMNIIQRTTNSKNPAFEFYGARGITVCDEWRNDFMSFYNWAMANGYQEHLTIDRINNDGNYEPSNCRWTTREVQSRNTRAIYKNNTSGYRGVHFNKLLSKFSAYLSVDKKRIYLGLYDTALDAAKAYNRYVIDNNLEHTLNII